MTIRRLVALAIGILALTGAAFVATASPAAADTCNNERNVNIIYGSSHYTLTCSGGNIYVNGRVTDKWPDGRCVRVKALIAGHWFYSPPACGVGNDAHFSWHNSGNEAFVYTYVE